MGDVKNTEDDHPLDFFEPENSYPKLLVRDSDIDCVHDTSHIHEYEQNDLLQVPNEEDVITDFLLSISSSFKEAHTSGESDQSLILEDFKAQDEEITANISEPFSQYSQEEGDENSIVKVGMSRVSIDTAAPFESVKAAVSKFGGILDWKAHRVQTLERQKLIEQELGQAQEEIPIYKKQSEDIEAAKLRILKELDTTKRLVEELKLNLERAQTEEQQAKQDADLVKLRVEELEQGIEHEASVSAKAQLEVARSRHMAAKTELKKVRNELEQMRKDYESLVSERETAERDREGSVLTSREAEKLVEEILVKVIKEKGSLGFAHGDYLEAEEGRIDTCEEREKERSNCEKELMEAEESRESLETEILVKRDKKKKLDTGLASLVEIKTELAAYVETKSGLDSKNEGFRKELEKVKLEIGKTFLEINGLKNKESSLNSEIENERSEIIAVTRKEEAEKSLILSLEGEMREIQDEISSLRTKERERRERMTELPVKLQIAGHELDHAKILTLSACEEWEKQKTYLEKSKAEMKITESRLDEAQKEIESAKNSEKLATEAIEALKESESNTDIREGAITLSLEEYYRLNKRAHEAQERANAMVGSVASQVEIAKENESKMLGKLKKVSSEMVAQKEALVVAVHKAENAKEAKLTVEQELRVRRAENEQMRRDYVQESRNPRLSFENTNFSSNFIHVASTVYPKKEFSEVENTENKEKEVKGMKKKKNIFPRIFMFLARRKAHASKSK